MKKSSNVEEVKTTKAKPKANTKVKEKVKEEMLEKEETKQLDVIEVQEELETKKENKVLKILRIIFLVITAPVWLPWKLLFVRRKNRKFKDMSTPIKVFRVLRSPITLPLKFCIFMLIIGIELFIGYKIRFSPVTYPITRLSVHNHYLQKPSKKLDGVMEVSACELNNHYDEFKKAFEYIDEWDLDSKNKMYVVLDANITKFAFDYIDDKTVSYYLNRFNNEPQLRDDVRVIARDVNKILNRVVKEFPESVPYEEFEIFTGPASAISGMVDYRQILDILWAGTSTMINTGMVEINESYVVSDTELEMFDIGIEMIVYYSKGHSIVESYDYINEKYKHLYEDNSTTQDNIITSKSHEVSTSENIIRMN